MAVVVAAAAVVAVAEAVVAVVAAVVAEAEVAVVAEGGGGGGGGGGGVAVAEVAEAEVAEAEVAEVAEVVEVAAARRAVEVVGQELERGSVDSACRPDLAAGATGAEEAGLVRLAVAEPAGSAAKPPTFHPATSSGRARSPRSCCRRSPRPVCLHRSRRASIRRMRARSRHALGSNEGPESHAPVFRFRRIVSDVLSGAAASRARPNRVDDVQHARMGVVLEPADDVEVLPNRLVATQEDAFRCGRSRGPRVGRDVVDRECRLRRRVSADDVHLAVAGTRSAAVAVAESRSRGSLRPRVSGDVVDPERVVALGALLGVDLAVQDSGARRFAGTPG